MYYCVIVAFCQHVLNEHAMLCYGNRIPYLPQYENDIWPHAIGYNALWTKFGERPFSYAGHASEWITILRVSNRIFPPTSETCLSNTAFNAELYMYILRQQSRAWTGDLKPQTWVRCVIQDIRQWRLTLHWMSTLCDLPRWRTFCTRETKFPAAPLAVIDALVTIATTAGEN